MTWQIGGDLGSGYTPPLSPNIGGDVFPPSGTLLPFGFEATTWGDASIFNRLQFAEPFGVFELAFGAASVTQTQQLIAFGITGAYGSPSVENYTRYLLPSGFGASSFGLPDFQNTSLGIFATGWDSLVIGPAESPHRISYYLALVEPAGISELVFGSQMVADAVRLLRPTSIVGAFGGPTVTNYTRTLEAIGFRTDEVGAHEVGTTQTISAFGFEPLTFGTTLAKDDRQFALVAGIAGQFGLSVVRRMLEFIRADSATQGTAFGPVDVFNRTQIIATRWPEGHVAGPVSAPFVELQNRPVFPFGFESLRFPVLGPSVRLGPPPIEAGLGNTTQWGFALVAPRIRSVATFGRTMEEFSSPIVQNAALNFTPVPFDAAQYGSPSVLNLWQFFRGFGVGNTLGMGAPFVAPRVRTLFVNGMFTFEAGRDHVLGRSPQFAQPTKITGEFGSTFIENRPRRFVTVRQDQPGIVERPAVANRNRTVRPVGFMTDTYGAPVVQNFRRFLLPFGFDSLIPGQHQIGDRLRTVRPPSISGTVGFHRARLFPEPPQPQYASPNGIESDAYGFAVVSGNSIFPDGIGSLRFGSPQVVHYGIFPIGWNSLQMADTRPDVISYQLILLGPTEKYPGVEERGIAPPIWSLGNAPRVSPYTVWAPTGAPDQAMQNHPPGLEEPIGIRRGAEIVVGGLVESPTVSNYLRTVFAGSVDGEIGSPSVRTVGRQIVIPQGFRGRWGFPTMIGGNLSISSIGFDAAAFGLGTVISPDVGNRTAQPTGFTGVFGQGRVSRNPEELHPFGFEPLKMGGGVGGVGGLWVSNEYPPFPAVGFEATLWGNARVSPNPQAVHPFGWDSFISGPEEIALRMRVRGRAFVSTLGANAERFGNAWVDRGQRTVQAFSVFKHGVPAPRVQPRLGVDGVDALTIPSPVVDQVEENVLKAKGWITDALGIPGLTLSMTVSGFSGTIGAPSVYHRLAPAGFSGEFGDTLVTGDAGHTCGMQARGVRYVWTEDEEFGVAEVDHG